jgi:SNF2 family DNA or RNA helicase
MGTFDRGSRVRHRSNHSLGLGEVKFVEEAGGRQQAWVTWASLAGQALVHPINELEDIYILSERLTADQVGVATFKPFILRLLGRWFQARHAMTGELSNQPFEMLPHQVVVANDVINSAPETKQKRWLLADDVGLGKTIEAGMIMEVLKRKTLGSFRCLVVAPKGLCIQWNEEMKERFGRRFSQMNSIQDLDERDLLIASIDTLKLKKRKEAVQSARRWDLVIFDEAHHLASGTEVQRYRLAQMLLHEAKKADNVLFLTATPHSGNVKHFVNMLGLLRPDLFLSEADLDRGDGRLKLVMIRNRKSDVTDAKGERIFKGIEPAQIIECSPTPEEVAFFEALVEHVRGGYNVANRLKGARDNRGFAVGFLMTTLRKLASSSRTAIGLALERRRAVLAGEDQEPTPGQEEDERFQGEIEERDAMYKVLAETSSRSRGRSKTSKTLIEDELINTERLIELLRRLGPTDSKLGAFIEMLKDEGRLAPGEKALVFTEYRGTQTTLYSAIEREFGPGSVVQIHGSMSFDQRKDVVSRFNESRGGPQFMVSTEAGGEGLNMQQACHVVINYDLPWNPARLQQRIGRVYRYGQRDRVRVFNMRWRSGSEAFIDERINERLEQKLDEISKMLAEVQGGHPEDIKSEVLGAVVSRIPLDEIHETSITKGEAAANEVIDRGACHLDDILNNPKGILGIFEGLKRFDLSDYNAVAAKVSTEHLEYFAKHYLAYHGVGVKRRRDGAWSFDVPVELATVADAIERADRDEVWSPLGKRVENATVDKELAGRLPGARLMRFGDLAFEAMVHHVRQSDFSVGVTSLEMPATEIGWEAESRGVLSVFEVRVLLQVEGKPFVLKDELLTLLGRTRFAGDDLRLNASR